jgi:hypothetical protein
VSLSSSPSSSGSGSSCSSGSGGSSRSGSAQLSASVSGQASGSGVALGRGTAELRPEGFGVDAGSGEEDEAKVGEHFHGRHSHTCAFAKTFRSLSINASTLCRVPKH